MKTKVVVDSCADLSEKTRLTYQIGMVPLNIRLDKAYLDQVNLYPEEYYSKIEEYGLPETSAPNLAQWKQAFDGFFREGYKKIILVTISRKLSNTFQQAVIVARKFYKDKIYVLDSTRASSGEGLLALKFQELLNKGYSVNKLIKFFENNKSKIELIGYMENLKMLLKSGRISKASEFIASLGQMKPMVHFKDGELIPLAKVISLKNAKKRLLKELKDRNAENNSYTLNITHADNEETAKELADEIKKILNVSKIYINYMGPVVGSRVGLNAQIVSTFPDIKP